MTTHKHRFLNSIIHLKGVSREKHPIWGVIP